MTEHQTEATAPDETPNASASEVDQEAFPEPADPTIEPVVATAPEQQPAPAAAGPHYLSIVAFTLGLVGIISPGLPSIAAIVLGHIGLSKEPSGRTFAIIGLVAGYVMVGLFVIGVIIFISIWGLVMTSIFTAIPWESVSRA